MVAFTGGLQWWFLVVGLSELSTTRTLKGKRSRIDQLIFMTLVGLTAFINSTADICRIAKIKTRK